MESRMKIKNLLKRLGLSGRGTFGLLFGAALVLGATGTWFSVTSGPIPSPIRARGEWVVAASDTRYPQFSDYTCSGTDDDVEILVALNAAGDAGGGTVKLLNGVYYVESGEIVIVDPKVNLVGQGPNTVITWNTAGVTNSRIMLEYTWSDGFGASGRCELRNITLDGSIHDHSDVTISGLAAANNANEATQYEYAQGTVVMVTAGAWVQLERNSTPANPGEWCENDYATGHPAWTKIDIYPLGGVSAVTLQYNAVGKETTQDLLVIDHMTSSPLGKAEILIDKVNLLYAPNNALDIQDGERVVVESLVINGAKNNTGDYGIGINIGGFKARGLIIRAADIGIKATGNNCAHTTVVGAEFNRCIGYAMDFGGTTGGAHNFSDITIFASAGVNDAASGIHMPNSATLTNYWYDGSSTYGSLGRALWLGSENVVTNVWASNIANFIRFHSSSTEATLKNIHGKDIGHTDRAVIEVDGDNFTLDGFTIERPEDRQGVWVGSLASDASILNGLITGDADSRQGLLFDGDDGYCFNVIVDGTGLKSSESQVAVTGANWVFDALTVRNTSGKNGVDLAGFLSTADGAPVKNNGTSTVTTATSIFNSGQVGESVFFEATGNSYVIASFTSARIVVVTGDASGEANGDIVNVPCIGVVRFNLSTWDDSCVANAANAQLFIGRNESVGLRDCTFLSTPANAFDFGANDDNGGSGAGNTYQIFVSGLRDDHGVSADSELNVIPTEY